MSTRRVSHSCATDVHAVVLDDALLDRLGSGTSLGDAADPAAELLATWRAECLAARVPAPPRRLLVSRALRSGTASRAIRTSWRAVASIAAALTLLVGATTAVGARSAEPGDVLWPVAKWLYADYAASVSASLDAERILSAARAALNDNDAPGARSALSSARMALPQIREQDRRRDVQSELDRLVGVVGEPPHAGPAEPATPTEPVAAADGALAHANQPITRSARVRSAATGELSGPMSVRQPAATGSSSGSDQPAARRPAGPAATRSAAHVQDRIDRRTAAVPRLSAPGAPWLWSIERAPTSAASAAAGTSAATGGSGSAPATSGSVSQSSPEPSAAGSRPASLQPVQLPAPTPSAGSSGAGSTAVSSTAVSSTAVSSSADSSTSAEFGAILESGGQSPTGSVAPPVGSSSPTQQAAKPMLPGSGWQPRPSRGTGQPPPAPPGFELPVEPTGAAPESGAAAESSQPTALPDVPTSSATEVPTSSATDVPTSSAEQPGSDGTDGTDGTDGSFPTSSTAPQPA